MTTLSSSPFTTTPSRHYRQQSNPNKRYSHTNTSPYRRFSQTSLAFDSPAGDTRDEFTSHPSSSNGSPYVSQFEPAYPIRGGTTLADELANALNDDSGVGDGDYESDGNGSLAGARQSPGWTKSPAKVDVTRLRDSGVELATLTDSTPTKQTTEDMEAYESPAIRRSSWDIGIAEQARSRLSIRSDPLMSSPFEAQKKNRSATSQKPSLDAYIADIAGLATPPTDSDSDSIPSFRATLSSLPTELALESSARTYARAASTTATATTASLHNLNTLVSSLLLKPHTCTTADLDNVTEQLSTLTPPRPTLYITASTIHARRATDNLLDLLSSLRDAMHMMHETESTAARRLQSTRELARALRKELDEAEKVDRWLRDGDLDRRLAGREGGKICREMVRGFDSVCNGMRAQLVEAAAREGASGRKVRS